MNNDESTPPPGYPSKRLPTIDELQHSNSDNPLYIQKRLKFGVLVLVFANIFMANLLINIDHGVVPAATTRLK